MRTKKLSNTRNLIAPPKYSECYANLSNNRIIFISEDITKDVASSLSALLLHYDNESEEDISIYINTNGGDAAAQANIYDIMQMIKAPIRTICIGKAYSAGAYILAAGAKGKRFITKNSSVMIHGLQCEFPRPREDQRNSQIYFDFLKNLDKVVFEQLAKDTGKTFEQIHEDCKKDMYMTSEQAKEYGIVDHIL
jgi:ATP-dependent Clp protease protease subunit